MIQPLPSLDAEMRNTLLSRLREITGDAGVLDADVVATRSAGAFRQDALQAFAIARPRTTEEVSAVMRLCTEARQAVVMQGGRTGLVHGCDAKPDELILSTERMNRIQPIDIVGRTATVEAGVILQDLQEAARLAGLYYGVDYGSRGTATVGGGIATNAGGNRVIRYGMTRASVLGLEVVLADGSVVSSMNAMLKNNSGYDLKQLFIGSEGTLGIVTRAVLRLHELPASQCTALVACRDLSNVQHLLKHMDRCLGGQLAAFEVMWRDYFELVTTTPALGRSPLRGSYEYYVLVESLGAQEAIDSLRFIGALETAIEEGVVADAAIAQSIEQRDDFWFLRDSVEEMHRFGPLHNFDISLPIVEMETYVGQIRAAIRARWPQSRCWIFGHMGDGNLHVSVAPCAGTDVASQSVEEIVYAPLRRFRGAVSAEHGIGVAKKNWLPVSRSEEEIALMRRLKLFLDPLRLLNPGKVV